MVIVDALQAHPRPEDRRGGWLGSTLWALACGAALTSAACKGAEAPSAPPPGEAAPTTPEPTAANPATPPATPDVAQTGSPAQTPPTGCGDATPGKRYVGRSEQDCARIRFVCETGEEYFSDSCGCGCQPIPPGAKP